jgi:hypothetical protein
MVRGGGEGGPGSLLLPEAILQHRIATSQPLPSHRFPRLRPVAGCPFCLPDHPHWELSPVVRQILMIECSFSRDATVDSPEIGHAPDPDKPVALRTCPISRPQCKFNSELQIGQLSDSRTKIPTYRTICSFLLNTQASLTALLRRRRHLF